MKAMFDDTGVCLQIGAGDVMGVDVPRHLNGVPPHLLRLVNGEVVAVEAATVPLATAKARAIAQVDAAAEATRHRYVTPGSAQAMVYQEKLAEAVACQGVLDAVGTPDEVDYPHLAAEVGVTAPDLAGVAAAVLAAAAAWRQVSAQIEGRRLAAKRDIMAATDASTVQAVLDSLTWPTPEASTPA